MQWPEGALAIMLSRKLVFALHPIDTHIHHHSFEMLSLSARYHERTVTDVVDCWSSQRRYQQVQETLPHYLTCSNAGPF